MSGSDLAQRGGRALSKPGAVLMVFDAHCILCSGFVRFILEREVSEDIIFINAGSAAGIDIAARHGLSAADLDETYLVVSGNKGFVRSDAAFEILRHLRRPWPAARILRIVPKSLRDAVYSVVARNRYDWFGRSDVCFVPSPSQKERFIL